MLIGGRSVGNKMARVRGKMNRLAVNVTCLSLTQTLTEESESVRPTLQNLSGASHFICRDSLVWVLSRL